MPSPSKPNVQSFASRVSSDQSRLGVVIAFFAALVLLGGSSRDDVIQLVALRPLAVLVIAYALWVGTRGNFATVRWPLTAMAVLALIMVVQMIPMPPSLWMNLPGHAPYAAMAREAGLDSVWQPISLSPSRTANALLALVVPLAGVLGIAILNQRHRLIAIRMIFVVAFVLGLYGLLQILGPTASSLYFYSITNPDSSVGTFANRNHHSVLLAVALTGFAWLFTAERARRRPRMPLLVAIAIAQIALVPMIIACESRAGLIVGAVALVYVVIAYWRSGLFNMPQTRRIRGAIGAALVIALVFSVVIASTLVMRSGSVARLVADNQFEDLRATVAPTLIAMVWAFFPFGAGFGTFVPAYQQFEPLVLLNASYLNQAHNDWLQIVIDGGLFAVAFLAVAVIQYVRRIASIVAARATRSFEQQVFLEVMGAAILVMALASIVDYPLRTPLLATLFAVAAALFHQPDEFAVAASRRAA